MITIIITVLGFVIFIYSIILHEIAHGLAAEHLGDPTAKLSGRLTLNPLPHIDPFMSILVPLFLAFSGFPIIIGAAKPVPIDPYNLRSPRKDMGFIGLAGPATNLVLAILFALTARIVPTSFGLTQLLANVCLLNLVLAIFNLIPIPPFDGGRVMIAILPRQYAKVLASLENFGTLIFLFLLLFPNPLFSLPGIIFGSASAIFRLIFPSSPLV